VILGGDLEKRGGGLKFTSQPVESKSEVPLKAPSRRREEKVPQEGKGKGGGGNRYSSEGRSQKQKIEEHKSKDSPVKNESRSDGPKKWKGLYEKRGGKKRKITAKDSIRPARRKEDLNKGINKVLPFTQTCWKGEREKVAGSSALLRVLEHGSGHENTKKHFLDGGREGGHVKGRGGEKRMVSETEGHAGPWSARRFLSGGEGKSI